MIKAATLPLGLTFLLATSPACFSQAPAAQEAAVNEAVYRQASRITLRQKLAEARSAQDRRDLPTAAKLYDDAWELVQKVGANVEAERDQTRAGLADVRLELARAAQHRGDYKDAATQVNDVLRVDPANAQALELKQANQKLLKEQRGKIPDEETKAQVPGIVDEKVKASTKVQDGKLLFEMGKLDDAEKKLREAVKEDPQNQAAYYYLNLVSEARYKEAMNKRDVTSRQGLVEIEQAWATPPKRDSLPQPNPYNRTNLIFTGKGRQAIKSKLERIHLDNVSWDGLPLSEVVKNLSDEARKRDPEKRGLNFIINQNIDSPGAAAPALAGGVDPTTGLPAAAAAPAEPVDISQIGIKISPPLTDVTLEQVLDAVVKVADKPIKYSIEDYAVVISLKAHEPTPLYVRPIKVDPNTFIQGLQSVMGISFAAISTSSGGGGGGGGFGGGGGGMGGMGAVVPQVSVAGGMTGGGGMMGGGGGGMMGGGGMGGNGLQSVTRTNDMVSVHAMVRQFFMTMGIDLNPPKSIFFNDREGTLWVRATLLDLDIIESAVQVLNIAPPQVNIKTKYVEISQNDTRALGFDWFLGNFLMGNGSMVASGGTAPSFNGAPTKANPQGFFPGTSPATTIPPSPSDQLITPGLRNVVNAPAVGTFSGILTDPQFRVVIKALEQRDGVDLLNEASVTTLSGRQTQIQVVDVMTIVTGNQLNQSGGGGGGGSFGNNGGGNGVIGSTSQYQTQPMPIGPTLDVIPYVSADGFTIQMTILPTITEFLGYDDPGAFVPQAQSASGGQGGVSVPIRAQLPLPHFRMRQVTTSAIVWDGQTVVLGGLITEDVTKLKDKVPVLGDIPVVGRLFRSESSATKKKNLMIFVTPTIVDPAGNRAHSEDEMPFNPNTLPVQKPFASAAQ